MQYHNIIVQRKPYLLLPFTQEQWTTDIALSITPKWQIREQECIETALVVVFIIITVLFAWWCALQARASSRQPREWGWEMQEGVKKGTDWTSPHSDGKHDDVRGRACRAEGVKQGLDMAVLVNWREIWNLDIRIFCKLGSSDKNLLVYALAKFRLVMGDGNIIIVNRGNLFLEWDLHKGGWVR